MSRAVRFGAPAGEPLRLFATGLSSRQLSNVRKGEPGRTLLDAEVALVSWNGETPDAGAVLDDAETTWWSPVTLLAQGREHTLVSPSRHESFTTLSEEYVLGRTWPSEPVARAAVFCLESNRFSPLGNPGPGGAPLVEFGAELVSETVSGQLPTRETPGWTDLPRSPPCWFAESAPGWGDLFTFGDLAVQPTRQVVLTEGRPQAPQCTSSETTLEWGCLEVQDDRVLVRGGDAATLWIADGEMPAWFVLAPGDTGVVRGLEPERQITLGLTVFFPRSEPLHQLVSFTTLPPRSHLVINEVFADPVTSEPAQEWVELYNDGTVTVDLGGYRLDDEGGSVTLPSVRIAPSGYALLVNDTYVQNLPGDLVPEPNALLVRLPLLAKSGLSNNGEALRLLDKWDMVVSTFAGTPKPAPGVSIARGVPWQVDGDRETFGRHAAPGASPGGANVRVRIEVK